MHDIKNYTISCSTRFKLCCHRTQHHCLLNINLVNLSLEVLTQLLPAFQDLATAKHNPLLYSLGIQPNLIRLNQNTIMQTRRTINVMPASSVAEFPIFCSFMLLAQYSSLNYVAIISSRGNGGKQGYQWLKSLCHRDFNYLLCYINSCNNSHCINSSTHSC